MAPRGFRFWLLTLAALAGVAATFALGAWQMRRAAEKLDMQAAIERREALPDVAQRSLWSAPPADILHRIVLLRGTWVPASTVFLDNRQMLGKAGFYVVTPLRLEGSDSVVLVQRGWAPRNFLEREKLPPIDTPSGVVELRARIAPAPAKLYEFAGAEPGPIRQNLELERFRSETGLPLLQVTVQQLGPPSDGLSREWPAPALGIERHYGYAFQWWALSGLIAILYAWFQFIAPRRKAHAAG